MLQKIATYIILALFIMTLGAASVFYLYKYKPLEADYKRVMAGLPELEKARVEVKKYREKENQDTAWINPAIDALSKGLSDEIKAGKAEVLAVGKKVVVNIAEQALYMPDSYTFSQDSQQLRTKLIGLLHSKELQGKTIQIGNTTEAVPAQTRGRKKIPGKDARTLAADRSAALITYFEKNNVAPDALIAAAYTSKQPDIGFSLKKHKTVIIIDSPLAAPEVAAKKEPAAAPQTAASPTTGAKSSATATAAVPAAAQTQPKTAPVQPAQPKTK
jgi:hypothetical protein